MERRWCRGRGPTGPGRLLGAVGALLGLALLLGAAPAGAPDFIRVEGTRFMNGDRPFFFVGANLNVMHEAGVRQQAALTIAAAAADGLAVGRVWALGEGEADAPSWLKEHYLFRAGPKDWQEAAYRQLDRVIAEAGKRGLRLMITLSNSWADYGGIPMYLRWAGQVDVESYGYQDRFFTDPRCRAWFTEHLSRIVGRTNSVTGLPYRDDPTILAWELQNEMHGTPEGAADRRRWVVEMSQRIRAIDPHHLIVPGIIGYNLQVERQNWIQMCRLPEVAFCDQHIYPEEHLRSRGMVNLRRFIDDRVQLAHHVVGKPIVFGEFGFGKGSLGSRALWHRRFLERVFHDGGNGALVWIYQPTLPWKRTYPVLVDQPAYRHLRRTLGVVARRVITGGVRARNPALGPEVGERPLAPTHAMMVRWGAAHGRWRSETPGVALLALDVERFHRAWFEEAGSWAGGILVHAYGRRTGWFEYRFAGPGFVPARLELRARLSSEYPGSSAPSDGFSRVAVSIDGVPVQTLRVMPDDGVGAWYTIVIEDPALCRRLRGGVHQLRFAVEDGPEGNGVSIYGGEAALNREPVDDPGPIQLRAWRRPAP